MNVVVTGATGFVGGFLCSLLMAKGYKVTRISKTLGYDLFDIDSWQDKLKDCDVIVHLAARVHQMKERFEDPLSVYRKVNTASTEKLAKYAVKYGVKKLVFLSTIKVNGEEALIPYSEKDTPSPIDPYGISKYEAELALKKISKKFNLKICCIRPPLVYGKGVRANFKSLIDVSKKRMPLPIKSIKNKRSFLYVENLCDFIEKSFLRDDGKFEVYLLADREILSTYELVAKISEILNITDRCFYFPIVLLKLFLTICGKKNIFQRVAGNLVLDASKAYSIWSPPFSLRDGLKRTLCDE